MSEKIPFVDRFGDAFKAATLTEQKLEQTGLGLRRFIHGWRLFAVAALVLVGAGGAVAATRLLSANSGQYVTAPGPAPGYKGELLNIGAHNALAVGMRDTRSIMFAPGYSSWHRGVVQVNLAAPSGQGPVGSAVMSTGDLRSLLETAATCSWANYWVNATSAGDSGGAAAAARQIERAPALLSEATIGGVQPNGLGPTIDAVRAGDVNLVRAMVDVGGMIGYGDCTALGPVAVIPAGMSRQRYHAKLAALRRAGERAIRSDPAAAQVNAEVLESHAMGAALGTVLERFDPLLAAKLAKQTPAGGSFATRVGELLVRAHPLRVYSGRGAGPGDSSAQTRIRVQGIGGIVVGAQLLGMRARGLPDTLTALAASGTETRVAFKLAQRLFAVDPLAEVVNLPPASS